jgi:hypothetical protein
MADQISSLTVQVNTKGAEEAKSALAKLGINAKKAEASVKKYKEETQRSTKAQKSYATQQDKTTAAVSRAEQVHKSARGGFRAMRGATQQLSFQLQDVAVQAQMGTDGLRILSQQGPQILSIFGPAGAVTGALIAFGALFASVLIPGIEDAEEEVDNLGDALDRLSKISDRTKGGLFALGSEFADLAKRSRALAEIELNVSMSKARSAIEQEIGKVRDALNINDVLRGSIETFEDYNDILDGVTRSVNNTAKVASSFRSDVNSLASSLGLTSRQTNDLLISFKQFEADKTPENFEELTQQVKGLFAVAKDPEKFQSFMELFGDSARGIFSATDALSDFAEAQKQIVSGDPIVSVEDIDTSDAEQKLQERIDRQNALRLARDKAAAQQRLEQIMIAAQDERNAVLEIEKNAQEQLQQDLDNKLITHQEHAQGLIDLATATQQKLNDIAEKGAQEEARRDARRAAAKVRLENYVANQKQALMSQSLNFVRQAFGEESAMYKAMFVASQALAVAQTIISSQTAAMAALAPPPVGLGPVAGLPYAKAIRVMGAVSAGLIAAQTFAGFSGGRATGGQVRGGQTYLVGEQGPELLTMGTSGRISSNDQLKQAMGGGESVQIVNNIDARGAGPEVETKIRQAMRETSEFTIAKVQDLMRRRRFV